MSTVAPSVAAGNPCANGQAECPGPGQLTRCALCPHSPTYWRLPENRAEGREYVPVLPIGDPDSPIQV